MIRRFNLGDNDNPGFRPTMGWIDMFWHMRALADWWDEARHRLDWQPIATYPKLGDDLALAEPVVLRSPAQWAYGAWYGGCWVKVTEGASYPLPAFQPTQWAEPTLDDAMLLGQE